MLQEEGEVAAGRETRGLCCGAAPAPRRGTHPGLLQHGSSGSCPLSALVWTRNAAGWLLLGVASPRLWDLPPVPGIAHVHFPNFAQARSGFSVPKRHPTGVRVSVPSLHLLPFLQPLWWLREGEEAELPAGSLPAAGAAAISVPGAGVRVLGSAVFSGFFFSAFRQLMIPRLVAKMKTWGGAMASLADDPRGSSWALCASGC